MQDTTTAKECSIPRLQGFPTWVIGSQQFEGEQTFAQLEAALAAMTPAAPQ